MSNVTAAPETRVLPEASPEGAIPDNVSTVGETEEEDDPLSMSPPELTALRKSSKRKHTNLLKRIDALIADRGSRRELRRFENELLNLMYECLRYNNALLQVAQLTDDKRQNHADWSTELERATNDELTRITDHVNSRKDEAASIVSSTTSIRVAREQERLRREHELEIEAMKNEIEHKKRLLELERDASKLNDELKRLRIHEELAEKYDEDDDIFEDFEERFNKLKASTPEKPHVAPVVKDDDRWREVFGSQFANSRSHPNSSSFVAPSNSVLHSLPRGLKRFNGDPKEFPLFMANFKFLVHDVINDDGVRLARLREALEPHVASRIANLLFNSSNYFSAMKALKNKYGHPFLISKGHIDALRKLPVVKEDDSKMLREFVEKLNSAVAALMTSDYSS